MTEDEDHVTMPTEREIDLAEMIKRAQANPGVAAAMRVYGPAQQVIERAQAYLRYGEPRIQSASDRTTEA